MSVSRRSFLRLLPIGALGVVALPLSARPAKSTEGLRTFGAHAPLTRSIYAADVVLIKVGDKWVTEKDRTHIIGKEFSSVRDFMSRRPGPWYPVIPHKAKGQGVLMFRRVDTAISVMFEEANRK
jgi:hypothetical protein